MNNRNAELRKQIAELEKQLVGMSHGHIDRPRIVEDIKARALQLEPEHHWSVVPLFWVSVVAMIAACIAAYPIVTEWLSPSVQKKQNDNVSTTPLKQQAPASLPSEGNK